MDGRVGPSRKLSAKELVLLNCGVGENSWESLGLQGDQTSQSKRASVLNIHWKDWCWSWNSNILATWCKELTPWERPWCWERLKAGGEGDNRGWDGWMASSTSWASFRSWWWTGKPGVLQSMGLQRVGYNWVTELNWSCRDYVPSVGWFLEQTTPLQACLWYPANSSGAPRHLCILLSHTRLTFSTLNHPGPGIT